MEDKKLKLLPATREELQNLVAESKIGKVLKGYRGKVGYDEEKLIDLMVRLGKLVEATPSIKEMEINPVIVTVNGAWAIDVKVILKETEKQMKTKAQFKTATTIAHNILASKFHYFTFETETPLVYEAGQYISVRVDKDRINGRQKIEIITSNQRGIAKPGGRIKDRKGFEGLSR